MADPAADIVPEPETDGRRRRPWKVTYAGGRTISTFRYRDHALERATEVVRSGRLRTVWVHERGSADMVRIARKRNGPSPKVDEVP